jgi:prolyl-tRNA synthetase
MCSRPPLPSPTSCGRRGVHVRVDDRPEYRPGLKFNEQELKGVPLRIEIGGRGLAAAAVTVARGDTGEKQQIPVPRAAVAIDEILGDVQASLFQAARDEQERRTLRDQSGYGEMIDPLVEPVDQRQTGTERRSPRLGKAQTCEQGAAAGAEQVAVRIGHAVLKEDRVDAVIERAAMFDQVQAEAGPLAVRAHLGIG